MRETYRTGELTERVTIRRKVETKNEYGTLERSDSDLGTVWAHVRPLSGQERDHAQQTDARANYLVVMRSQALSKYSIVESDYIVWDGDEMNIRHIGKRGRSLYVELECERGAA